MPSRYRKLTLEEAHILLCKGTEAPFSGEYCQHQEKGVYHCKQCDAPLFESRHKFVSHCGWPSFDDDQLSDGACHVQRCLDADGRRVEIVCKQCGGHLGHVFEGEGLTVKNMRYCVNALSLFFHPSSK